MMSRKISISSAASAKRAGTSTDSVNVVEPIKAPVRPTDPSQEKAVKLGLYIDFVPMSTPFLIRQSSETKSGEVTATTRYCVEPNRFSQTASRARRFFLGQWPEDPQSRRSISSILRYR
ncbi:hypothetical protein V3C99_002900 [Haemonchus contortus]